MSKQVKVLTVAVDGGVDVAVVNGLEDMQKLVGGMIEPVPVADGVEVFVNEEGKICGMEKNEKADFIFRRLGGDLFVGDYLAGPVFFTGGVDADGNTLSVANETVERITQLSVAYDVMPFTLP